MASHATSARFITREGTLKARIAKTTVSICCGTVAILSHLSVISGVRGKSTRPLAVKADPFPQTRLLVCVTQ